MPIILFFHGNGETARDYDGLSDEYRSLPVYFIVADYRGYGPSTGSPSVSSFLSDAHLCLDETMRLVSGQGFNGPLVVMGRSLGSAPALELASSRSNDIAALVIESGFARLVPLLDLMGIPASRLGITEDDGPRNLEKMGRIDKPTLILHAERDEIIPIADAELLHEACKDPSKIFVRVPRAGHNDIQISAGSMYFDAIRDLLNRVR